MIRRLMILAGFLPLCGCMTLPSLHLPHLGGNAAPAAPVAAAPTVCPASITADLSPAPPVPDNARLPAIEMGAPADLQAGFAAYTGWLHDYANWGKAGWQRLQDAQTWCRLSRAP